MDKIDPSLYFDLVEELTSQRTLETLTNTLLDILHKHTHSSNIHIYKFEFKNGNRACRLVSEANFKDSFVWDVRDPSSSFPLLKDKILIECLTKGREYLCQDKKGNLQRLLIPVKGLYDISQVLVMSGTLLQDHTINFLIRLMHIYNNQFLLLRKMELDPLTGLLNREGFNQRLIHITSKKFPKENTIHKRCFALCDIDHFKVINDTFGHLFGDEVLILVAGEIISHFRHDDLKVRYGGEEIALVLNANLKNAHMAIERFRQKIEDHKFPHQKKLTISIGLTSIPPGINFNQLISQADTALYYAKNHGRNQLHVYEHLLAEKQIDETKTIEGEMEIF